MYASAKQIQMRRPENWRGRIATPEALVQVSLGECIPERGQDDQGAELRRAVADFGYPLV